MRRAELDRHLAALSGEAGAAFEAIRALAAAPTDALPYLRQTVRQPSIAEGDLRPLIRDLGSPDFATRERATEALRKAASMWEPVLRAARDATDSPEVQRRLDTALAAAGRLSGDALRAVRAIEALEWSGTTEAIRLLEDWSRDWSGTIPGRESRSAAERLKRR